MTMAQTQPNARPQATGADTVTGTIVKGLNMALHELMAEDDSFIVLGQDVGWDEGVFRVTEGLVQKYGETRVLDTPLAEANIVGAAIGMAIAGCVRSQKCSFPASLTRRSTRWNSTWRGIAIARAAASQCRWSFACPTAAASAPSSSIPKAAKYATRTCPA